MGTQKFVLERYEPDDVDDRVIPEIQSLWAAQTHEIRPLDPPTPVEVFEAMVKNFPAFIQAAIFLARTEGGDPAGFAMVSHRQTTDDPHLADLQVWARPEFRRQGVAVSLLDAACLEAEKRDYRTLTTTTAQGVGWGEDLCRSIGSAPTHERRTWRLPVEGLDRDHIRMLTSQAAERARGYELIDLESPLPDDIVDDAVELLQFLTQETSVTDARLTTEALRQLERTWGAIGRGQRWQFARHEESGTLAGVLDAVWNPTVATHVAQDQIVVRPEFRGRSLGMWMKGCMIDKVLDAWPEATEIRTSTVYPNPAMDSVDQRLGFVPYLKTTVWKCHVSDVRRWLSTHSD